MENRENFGESLGGHEQEGEQKEKQIIEGLIGKNPEDLEKVLPPGVTSEMVDKFIGSDGFHHWHLKPEHIKDKKEKEKYEAEKEQWL